MNFIKIHKKVLIFIFIIIVFSINTKYSYSVSDSNYTEFIPTKIDNISDGANVEINLNETNGYELDINVNTKGLDSGYYTTYLYENQNRNWSNYEAMSFFISNKSDSPIRINLNIKKRDGRVFSPTDDNAILIKKENDEIMERVHPSYGTIELPKDFKGTLYIPFNTFREKNNLFSNEVTYFSEISSWGIITTLAENEEKNFKLSEFSLVNKGSYIERYLNFNFSIKGDTLVEIPVAGEVISDYNIEMINGEDNVKFKLMHPIEGVTISENGRLTLTADMEAQKIQICAILGNKLSEKIEVQLLKSWTLNAKELDGTSKSIPKPEELSKTTKNEKMFLTNNNILIRIRISIVLLIILFGILYCFWKRDTNK